MRPLRHVTALSLLAIGAYLFVKPGAAEGQVVVATAATDKILGVSNQVGFPANDTGDYITEGEAEVTCGGVVAIGDYLTSNATGQAIATTTAGNVVRAIALQAGVAGDVINVQLIYMKF
jgi:hypothetical protein